MAYIVKITLENTHPPVWRRLLLPEGTSFEELHEMIQLAFGWTFDHLHDFTFPIKDIEIIPRGTSGITSYWEYEDQAIVKDFFQHFKWIRYTYDFGDDWRHKIVLEKTDQPEENGIPRVLKAKGDGFEEDSGGVWFSEERISFNMDAVNKSLQKISVKNKKGSKKSLEIIQHGQLNRDLERMLNAATDRKKEKEIYSQIKELKQEYLDSFGSGADESEDYFDQGVLGAMICDWQEMVKNTIAQKKSIQLNLTEICGTMAEALDGYEEITRQMMMEDLLLSQNVSHISVENSSSILAEAFCQRPEFFLGVLNRQEYDFLHKLWKMPVFRSCFINSIEEADAIIHGITLGLINLKFQKGFQDSVWLNFTNEASVLFENLTKAEVEKVYRKNHEHEEQILGLIQLYGIVTSDFLYKKWSQLYSGQMDRTDFQRFLSWNLSFMRKVYMEGEYMCALDISADVLEERKKYQSEAIPYRDFQKKKIGSISKGICHINSFWKDLDICIRKEFRCDPQEADLWISEIYSGVRNYFSPEDLWEDFQTGFDLSSQLIRLKIWMVFMGICLETPLPSLKGHTRLEYAALTGQKPWELDLTKPKISSTAEERYGAFLLEPELQYGIYQELKARNPKTDLSGKLKELMEKENLNSLDFQYLLTALLGHEGKEKQAMQLLRKISSKDESVSLMLKMNALDIDSYAPSYENQTPVRRETPKIGRNDPCPCGSGKKYKKCCMGKDTIQSSETPDE